MVIGNGLLARSFDAYRNDNEVVIFASGVSNSKETDPSAFNREKELLQQTLETLTSKTIVYFSTCSIEDPSLAESLYVHHKIEMERLVMDKASKWHIFRLPQVVGPTKSPTLIHFLFEAISLQKPFSLHTKATRNLIWHEDIYKIAAEVMTDGRFGNQVLNIASPFHLKVTEIVAMIEEELCVSGQKHLIDEGGSYMIDTEIVNRFDKTMKIFSDDYPRNTIAKYGQYYNGVKQ